jgi:ABC-type phosphate transport system substrate-binding protein
LSLIEENQTVGYPPSSENMLFADYPLRSSLFLVLRDPEDEKTRIFVSDFFDKKRLGNMEKNGLVKVPENMQKQALLEFDLDF